MKQEVKIHAAHYSVPNKVKVSREPGKLITIFVRTKKAVDINRHNFLQRDNQRLPQPSHVLTHVRAPHHNIGIVEFVCMHLSTLFDTTEIYICPDSQLSLITVQNVQSSVMRRSGFGNCRGTLLYHVVCAPRCARDKIRISKTQDP